MKVSDCRVEIRECVALSVWVFLKVKYTLGHVHVWGGWAIALSPIMKTTITVERLQKRGYLSF